jgi:radical SAM protein with 4Fe4S-binding SPASM domain
MQATLERRLGESVEELEKFPRYFEIETVNACNARCPMCTIDDWDRRDGLMEMELFRKIADEIGKHSETVRRVALYRDGEPLIDKRLATKVQMLKERDVKRVGISTNVALLSEERAEGLLLAGIDEVILSIDSLNKDVYEKIRVGLDFDEVMANARGFIAMRDALQSDCQVWVRMIRQESNRFEWASFEKFWRARVQASDRVDYLNIHNWGGQLVNFKAIAPANIVDPCVALWSLMVVFANGDVPLCNVDYNNTRPLGNVRDSSIAALWQSKEQDERRGEHLNGKRTGICQGCTVWSEKNNKEKVA